GRYHVSRGTPASCASLTSAATPTTVIQRAPGTAIRTRVPIASPPGQSDRASRSLTTTTGSAAAPSVAENARPRRIGVRIVSKSRGDTRRSLTLNDAPGFRRATSSDTIGTNQVPPPSGLTVVAAALVTPGAPAIASTMRAIASARTDPGGYMDAGGV